MREVPRIVPPAPAMPRTSSRPSGRMSSSMRPCHPFLMPTTSWAPAALIRVTTLRITALRPGQSPPAVRMPMTLTAHPPPGLRWQPSRTGPGGEGAPSSVEEHRLAAGVPDLGSGLLRVVELFDVHPLHALARDRERNVRIGAAAQRHKAA